MKPLVYLAAPYTNPDPVENTHRAIRLGTKLVEAGKCTPVIPHLSLLWHAVTPKPIDFWYAYDLELLARCDFVLRISGPSTGADAEVKEAERLGIPVAYDVPELYALIPHDFVPDDLGDQGHPSYICAVCGKRKAEHNDGDCQ